MLFDHPMLAEGIPNARHEAIRNAHFVHSCIVVASYEDYASSRNATAKATEASSGKESSLERNFQIYVNNKFIDELEQVAALCLFNALSVVTGTHPVSDSFVAFNLEEASRLDVAAVITPGTTVAICPRTGAQQYQRYSVQPGANVKYARALGCDRSTHTISVAYSDTGLVERRVPWSWIVGMEDVAKRECLFSYQPTPKSISDADKSPPALGHLILALKWCRHAAATTPNETQRCPLYLVKCVAEQTGVLLCTEVLLHDDMNDKRAESAQVNMQLLDLFECIDTGNGELRPAPSSRGNRSLAFVMGEDVLCAIQKNLQPQLDAASVEREEEQKMWSQNNSGWDSTSFWGSSTKRQGRRSPFRLTRKNSG